jgi:hypothetical protein
MYGYNNYPYQKQPLPPTLQQMSRSSPPQTTWAVPQTHNLYYAAPSGSMMPNREDHVQFLPRPGINPSSASVFNNATFSSSMNASSMSTSAEYFPNVIDTSMFAPTSPYGFVLTIVRSLGLKGVRRARIVPLLGRRYDRFRPRANEFG